MREGLQHPYTWHIQEAFERLINGVRKAFRCCAGVMLQQVTDVPQNISVRGRPDN
jgi:hypothetical protein